MRFAMVLAACAVAIGSAADARHFVGYYPSWLETKSLAATSPRYSHVVLAFARPDFSWNGRDWTGTGLQFAVPPATLRNQIKSLQARGTKVLVAVGGATYGRWGGLAGEQDRPGVITAALTRFVSDMGLDGVDVDYERDGVSPVIIAEYRAAITVLRSVAKGKLLTLAAWSTGADCTAQTGLEACGGKYSESGGGRERLAFRDTAVMGKIDIVNVMSYDAGVAEFDPVMAWRLYRDILPSKVVVNIGLEIAPEGWGDAILVSDAAGARCSNAKIVKDQFQQSVNKPYAIGRILRDGPLTAWPHSNAADGAMLWHIFRDEKIPLCGGRRAASSNDVEGAARALLDR